MTGLSTTDPFESRPTISWLPEWLEGGGLATIGPIVAFVVCCVLAAPFLPTDPGSPDPRRVLATLASLTVVVVVVLIWLPHWWAWRICGPLGRRRFLGGALWVARFPRGTEGDGARLLTATALCAGDYLGFGAADGAGLLALAVSALREGDLDRVAALRELFAREGRPADLYARRIRKLGLETLAATLLRVGEPAEALAWSGLGRGRGLRFLRLVARRRLGERLGGEISTLAWNSSWLLAPYRLDRLAMAEPAAAPVRRGAEGAADPPARLHLELLADAARGRLNPEALQALALRWPERWNPEAGGALLRRAADLDHPTPTWVPAELEAALRSDLSLLAGAARGRWQDEPQGPFAAALRAGRIAPLHARLERETEPFRRRDGLGRELESSLVELDRWLRMRLAAARLAALEGPEALAALWWGGLRYAACNWPIALWNHEGKRAQGACETMSRWCAATAERLEDAHMLEASREMLGRCERQLEGRVGVKETSGEQGVRVSPRREG